MGKNIRKKYYKSNKKRQSTGLFFISVLVFFALTFVFKPEKNSIDWQEAYRFKIPTEDLFAINKISEEYETDFSKMIACYMLENNFFKNKEKIAVNNFIINYANIRNKYKDNDSEKYYNLIKNIFEEIKSFPVLKEEGEDREYIYGDSFGAERTYGGKRTHMGCDIMDRENIRGQFKIISMTDGVIEKLGWNEKGGWRVGIRSKNGNYYYYAHLDSYADGLSEGQKILAGDLLGFMGDSGYSKIEGTKGKFEVHLHVGIEIENEKWINPYPFLRLVEKERNNI